MSFLLRIAARAAPVSRAAPILMPKDAGVRRAAAPASPEEEMPDEGPEAQRSIVRRTPLRRAEPEEKDETVPRQEIEEDEEPAAQRATMPPEEEAEEEEPAAGGLARKIAREAEEDDENLRPARPLSTDDMSPDNARLPEEVAGEPEPPDLRALRRAVEPPKDEMEPEAARSPADMGEDEDDANMRPLRRAVGPTPASAAAPAVAVSHTAADMDFVPPAPTGDSASPAFNSIIVDAGRTPPVEDITVPSAAFAPAPTGFARPQVIIDQLEVVIHEPAPALARAPRFDAGRALRARYLRRL